MQHLIGMKRIVFLLALAGMVACSQKGDGTQDTPETEVTDPITIESPSAGKVATRVVLSPEQQAFMKAGQAFGFRCMEKLYTSQDLIFSPLSLQYALAMAANGASGETADEIVATLGYGTSIQDLNAYCNLLLRQLPSADPSVSLKLTDAMIVLEQFPVQAAFKNTLESLYYAPVDYINPSGKAEVVARINDWAKRNTNGFIDPFLSPDDISDDFVAAILNALYFKAKWSGNYPMFEEDFTQSEAFYLDDGSVSKAQLMRTARYFGYAERNGYRVVELPYGDAGAYVMYVLLPDTKGAGGLAKLVAQLAREEWSSVIANLDRNTEVILKLPKFEAENKLGLKQTLAALGIQRAFSPAAQFDAMFDVPDATFCISNVLQKARIAVAEWGTEAAAVTAVMVDATSAGPGDEPKQVEFFADHPFAYVIAEKSSGAILFQGTFTGK